MTESYSATDADERGMYGTKYTVARSVLNHYWPFSFIPIGVSTAGMSIAAISHGWQWDLWAVMIAFLWIADQGMKTLDLSTDDLAVRMNSRIQRVVGFAMIGVASVLGVVLAYMSTWWFLVVLTVGIFLGVAYNLEWFDGRFHDKKYVTGWGNFGFVLGWLSAFTGYFLLAEQFSLGIAIFGIGPTLGLGTLIYVEQDIKENVYESMGFEYTREIDVDVERLQRRTNESGLYRVAGYVAMGVGLMVEVVL